MAIKLVRCAICEQRHIIDMTELNDLIANFSKKPEEIENKPCDYICNDCSNTEEYSKNYPKEGVFHAVLPQKSKVIEKS